MGQNYPNGKEIEIKEMIFQIDGYTIADRLLEGVMFDVQINERGDVLNVNVEEDAKEYFEQFNQNKFFKQVKEDALVILEEGDEVEVSNDIQQKYNINTAWVDVQDDSPKKSKPQPTPLKVGKVSF